MDFLGLIRQGFIYGLVFTFIAGFLGKALGYVLVMFNRL
jgi:hypothetical protein